MDFHAWVYKNKGLGVSINSYDHITGSVSTLNERHSKGDIYRLGSYTKMDDRFRTMNYKCEWHIVASRNLW